MPKTSSKVSTAKPKTKHTAPKKGDVKSPPRTPKPKDLPAVDGKVNANNKAKDHVARKFGFETISKTTSRVQKDGKRKRYGCSIGKDANGYFAYTHRAQSKRYPSKDKIPERVLKFIDSTVK